MMLAFILTFGAVIIFSVGFALGEYLATRRYNGTLWEHQQELDRAMLMDMSDRLHTVRILGSSLADAEMEDIARTVH